MSTCYVPSSPVPFDKIKEFDFQGITVDEIEDDTVWLTDGISYMCAVFEPEMEITDFGGAEPVVSKVCRHKGVMFSRYGANDPERIIKAVEAFFHVTLVSEYDEGFNAIVESRNEIVIEADAVETCAMCGAALKEDDDTYCDGCMVTMGAGGAAHTVAEKIKRSNKKSR